MMLVHVVSDAVSQLPLVDDPGVGSKPPGAEKLNLVIKWVTWIAFTICILGIVIGSASALVGLLQ